MKSYSYILSYKGELQKIRDQKFSISRAEWDILDFSEKLKLKLNIDLMVRLQGAVVNAH